MAVIANAIWVVTQRHGQPLDIDEAGYACIAMNDYLALHGGGIGAWWYQIVSQSIQAPLAPALASIVDWLTGVRVLNIFFVSILAYGILLVATLGLTARWSRQRQIVALFFVAASPVLLNYSRSFNFSELAAACMAGTLYFGYRSNNCASFGAAVGWGACLGLMVLSRTMTIAFVPGIVLAAGIPVIVQRSLSRLLRLVTGIAVAAAIAATWYVNNISGVYKYLTSFGYGARANAYGPSGSLLSPHAWYVFFLGITDGYLYVGLAMFIAVGWLAGIVAAVKWCYRCHVATDGSIAHVTRKAIGRVADDGVVVPCAIVALIGVLALMSTRNQGSDFIGPLVVPLVIVASWGALSIGGWAIECGSRLVTSAIAFVGASLVALTSIAAVLTFFPIPVKVVAAVSAPDSASVTVWDSRGTLRLYEDAGRIPLSIERNPGSRATGHAWLVASAFADNAIHEVGTAEGRNPVALFAFGGRMLNINTVQLASLMRYGAGIQAYGIAPLVPSATVQEYVKQLAPLNSVVATILTVTSVLDQFVPYVPARVGTDYARSLHFQKFARFKLPDGQALVVWARISASK